MWEFKSGWVWCLALSGAWASGLSGTGVAEAATPLKVLSFNVGSAHLSGLGADCDHFKLCLPDAIKRVQSLVADTQPDIILFQETQGVAQLFGTTVNGPVLDSAAYEGQCTLGASGLVEVCVVWKKSRLALAQGGCVSLSNVPEGVVPTGGGSIGCALQSTDGRVPQLEAVSVHGNTAGDPIRFQMFKHIWDFLAANGGPSIVGGDFNAPSCTSGDTDCAHPAPAEFGTVFGRHVAGFGRWIQNDNYYGYSLLDTQSGFVKAEGTYSTHYFRRFDHVFANFGEAPVATFTEDQVRAQPCEAMTAPWSSRVPFDGGFKVIIGGTGWETDHFPVLSCLVL